MKKKYLLVMAAGILTAVAMAGGTIVASNVKGKEAATADIRIRSVGVTIYEDQDPFGGKDGSKKAVVPGTEYKLPKEVVNTVTDGYDVYVKVVLYKEWEKDGEELYPETGEADILYIQDASGKKTDLAMARQNEVVNDWIVQYADSEQIILYYTRPVKPGQATTEFLSGIAFGKAMGKDYADAEYRLEYQVTAVQANHARDAIAAEFGVFAAIGEDGTITAISEKR